MTGIPGALPGGQPQQATLQPIYAPAGNIGNPIAATSGTTTTTQAAPPAPISSQQYHIPGVSTATAQALAAGRAGSSLNLDEIFGDCFFTPEGETVFLSDQPQGSQDLASTGVLRSTEEHPQPSAYRYVQGNYIPATAAGGIATTNLTHPGKPAVVMGAAAPGALPQSQVPSNAPVRGIPQRHHMGYAIPAPISGMEESAGTVKTKRRVGGGRPSERKMSEQQKVERRERNREHAKRSRIRKKFLLESLQQSVSLLKDENERLKGSIRSHLGNEESENLLNEQSLQERGLIASNAQEANKVLDDPDFSFIKALQTAQQNFVVTDPSLPDNPIVYATQGFLNLTGYTLDQVLGRNCRFLQGPETDPKAVEKIRKSIEDGTDMSVCLLNYRVDGTTFWNQFFIAALRDAGGNVTNYVGVQCKVSDQYAANVCRRQNNGEDEEGGGVGGNADGDDEMGEEDDGS